MPMLLHIVRTMAKARPQIIAPANAHFAMDWRPIIIATPAATMPTAASTPLRYMMIALPASVAERRSVACAWASVGTTSAARNASASLRRLVGSVDCGRCSKPRCSAFISIAAPSVSAT